MGIIVEDHFNNSGADVSDITGGGWTPDTTGTGYTEEQNTTAARTINLLAANDYINSSGTASGGHTIIITAQPNPTVAEYDIEFTNLNDVADDTSAIAAIARFTDTNNYYAAGSRGENSASDKSLCKIVGGVNTELASSDAGQVNGETYKFEVRDAAKKLFYQGVEELSNGDNSLGSVGKAGLGWGGIIFGQTSVHVSYQIDDFIITEVDAVAGGGAGQPTHRRYFGIPGTVGYNNAGGM